MTVKFIAKKSIEESMLIEDETRRKVPVDVLRYRSNTHFDLPMHLDDMEDEDFFYIITALHGIPANHPRGAHDGIFGNQIRYHAVNWDVHYH